MNGIKFSDTIKLVLIDIKEERCSTVFSTNYIFVFETEQKVRFNINHFEVWKLYSDTINDLKEDQFVQKLLWESNTINSLQGKTFNCKFGMNFGLGNNVDIEKLMRNYCYDKVTICLLSMELSDIY